MQELTQHEKIFTIILLNRNKEWWRASDFQKEVSGIFVGYKASARMSELIRDYPTAFSVRMDGRFREIRFKFEDAQEVHRLVPHDFGKHLVINKIIK